MRSFLERLWKLEGTVDRSAYAIAGVAGFLVKYAIDWSIAHFVFERPWSPLSYWYLLRSDDPGRVTPAMFLAMFAVSVPFLWFGMAMTLLRLRSAGRSAGWAAFFFVPVLNVVLFLLLMVAPPSERKRNHGFTAGTLESALFAVLLTVGIAALAIFLSTRVLATYGIGLFVAVPFSVGFLSAYIERRRHPTSTVRPYLATLVSLTLLGGLLLAIAWEGMVCLVMAAPVAFVAAGIGALLGSGTAGRPRDGAVYGSIALLPLMIAIEAALPLPAPVYKVDTAIVIDAPPETVWRNVVTFAPITESPEWYFRAGIAYPLSARIRGTGVGAVRRCEFTTGAFVEPITVWREPHILKFDVTANPPPMRELSPYANVDAPHLHGFLVSHGGQFELTPLPNGRTRLTGTTWYQHHLWPAPYWRLWSDAIIHRIHLRVLRHIKGLSERS
jgi:hypothetical protein